MKHAMFLTYKNWITSERLVESYKNEYVSMWWKQHLVPLLGAGESPPKRFWLHQLHRHPEIYHRMSHDYRDSFNSMLDALDNRARLNFHRSYLAAVAAPIKKP